MAVDQKSVDRERKVWEMSSMALNSEWELIKKISLVSGTAPCPGLIQGIGDDCAVFVTGENRYGLITTDISIENVHFKSSCASPEEIGFKAMSGNMSDIAAMGGRPCLAFVSLGLPRGLDASYVESLYRGMTRAAGAGGPKIAGGDISSSEVLVINITVYGEAGPEKPVMRKGAQTGDTIYLTGTTGPSRAGLEILTDGIDRGLYPELVKKHLTPGNRTNDVEEILTLYRPSAMIDVSDGLLSDLRHLCEASDRGFVLFSEKIPVSPELQAYARDRGKGPLAYVLNSGEEFELVFTASVSPVETRHLRSGIPVTPIGSIVENGFFLSEKGTKKEIAITGYDHFI